MTRSRPSNNIGKAPPYWVLKTLTYFHVSLHRINGGFNTLAGKEMCFVTMTGARSNRTRVIPLLYIPYGKSVLLVASAGGAPRHPAWYHNLVKHPNIEIEHKGNRRKFCARLSEEPEKNELWALCYRHYSAYEKYRERTMRDIPLFVCEPKILE